MNTRARDLSELAQTNYMQIFPRIFHGGNCGYILFNFRSNLKDRCERSVLVLGIRHILFLLFVEIL